jgi:hypothetical protein
MKRPNTFWLMSICAMALLLGAAHWFHARPIYAQQNSNEYDDGTVYVYAYIDVDSTYDLYYQSYAEWDVGAGEDSDDFVDDEIQIDVDQSIGYDDFAPAAQYISTYPPVAFNPLTPGHEYGVRSIGWICVDYIEESGCNWQQETPPVTTSVNVAALTIQITGITPSSDYQGGQGTLTITGSNFVENSSDQLTINVTGGGNPFTLTSALSTCTTACTATFSYDLTGYPAGALQISLTNNEGTSINSETFTVLANTTQSPPADPCAVTSSPQVAFSSIVPTGTAGGSGTMAVSFSGADYAAISASVTYGPNSTPSSIAANIAALISKNYYRYGLGAKAYGPIVIYSGNTALGTVSNVTTGPSIGTDSTSTAATAAENACHSAPPPPLSMYAVAYSAYIPVDHVSGPFLDICTYAPVGGIPDTPVVHIYRGDATHNTYRVTQAVSLNFTNAQASGYYADTGLTENYGFGSSPYLNSFANLSPSDDDAVYLDKRTSPPTGIEDCYLRDEVGKANTSGWLISSTVTNSGADVAMSGLGQNPLSVPIGDIGWNMTTYIDAVGSRGYVDYNHTCYPMHQIKVANTTLYRSTVTSNSTSHIVACLVGAEPHTIGTSPITQIR